MHDKLSHENEGGAAAAAGDADGTAMEAVWGLFKISDDFDEDGSIEEEDGG